ncbi:uncharacterized protein LOC106955857 isoform X1 [Poecilia latipinna]|uniref:uncharacterized protein LOC106955857 isoform X1 n=1 Tax=Poecilia latipinna TaxID=48699 RepID=UPI00072DDC15|nr:PREDICTED: uncharacterized protein LOC106955857 isoform X1 [Poecilia latipinna]
MIQLLVVLLLLHQGYTLVPVTTVPLGDPATFTCSLPAEKMSNNELHWYKQNAGQTLGLIVKLRKHAGPAYGPDFSSSRVHASRNEDISSLTILSTVQEDEGMYHCAIIDWTENYWHGTYLLLTEQTKDPKNNALVITMTCFVISVIVNVILICYRTPKAACKQVKGTGSTSLPATHDNMTESGEYTDNDNENLDYAALQFSGRKSTRGMKKKQLKTEEDVYAQVKV